MENRTSLWKTGGFYPVTALKDSQSGDLYLNREALSRLSSELKALVTGDLTITVSPDWRALKLYSELRWEALRQDLELLPNDNPEARRIQRLMLGHAAPIKATEPLNIEHPIVHHAVLAHDYGSPLWLIVFDKDNAELWAEHELTGLVLESRLEKSPLVEFLRGHQADHQGRFLDDILALDDFWLEHTHDYIQWLFPIDTPSRANLKAPVLSEPDRQWFRRDPYLRFQQRQALDRMLSFCGLHRLGDIIQPCNNLHPYRHIWLKRGGHNHLRITRMIRSLYLCHQPELARAVQQAFIEIGQERGYVQPDTLGFWMRATESG